MKCLSDIPASNRLVDYSLLGIGGKGKHGRWHKKQSSSKTMKSLICYTAVIALCKIYEWVKIKIFYAARRQYRLPSLMFVSSMCVGVSVKREIVWCFILDLVFVQNRKVPSNLSLIYYILFLQTWPVQYIIVITKRKFFTSNFYFPL